MKITKVKVNNEPVLISRSIKEGQLLIGEDNKQRDEIYTFIIKEKMNSILDSMLNKILKKPSDAKSSPPLYSQLELTLKEIFKNTWLDKTDIDIQLINTTEEQLCDLLKYRFKKRSSDHAPSEFVANLLGLLNGKEKSIATCWKIWVEQEKCKFQFISDSISQNSILTTWDNHVIKESNTPKYNSRRAFLLMLAQKKWEDVEGIIHELSETYQTKQLIMLCQQTVEEKYNELTKGSKEDVKINHFGSFLKDQLNKHQKKLFGKKEGDDCWKRNRENIGLNYYHQMVKEYFESSYSVKDRHYFQKGKPNHEQGRVTMTELAHFWGQAPDYTHFHFVIKQKIRNKLRELAMTDGRLIDNMKASWDDNDFTQKISDTLTTRHLQQQKLHISLKKKLINDINFAGNQLRNLFINQTKVITQIIDAYKQVPNLDQQGIRLNIKDNNLIKIRDNLVKAKEQSKVLLHPQLENLLKNIQHYQDVLTSINQHNADMKSLGPQRKRLEESIISDFNAIKDNYEKLKKLNSDRITDTLFHSSDFIGSDEIYSNYLKDIQQENIFPQIYIACLRALQCIRHAVFHHQQLKFDTLNGSDRDYQGCIQNKLDEDQENMPSEFVKRLYTNNVFKFYTRQVLEQILPKSISLTDSSTAFTVSFKHVIKRAQGLKYSWAILIDNTSEVVKRQADTYLLLLIYQYAFIEWLQESKHFKLAIKQVKDKSDRRIVNPKINPENHNRYEACFSVDFEQYNDPKTYLAKIQSLLVIEQDKVTEGQKTENKYHDYLIDLYVEGFSTYLEQNNIVKTLQEGKCIVDDMSEDEAIKSFSNLLSVKEQTSLTDEHVLYFYGLFLLLDKQRLNHLKGDLIKYKRMCEQLAVVEAQQFVRNIDTLIFLLSLRSLYVDRADFYDLVKTSSYDNDKNDILSFMSCFMQFDITPEEKNGSTAQYVKALKHFEPNRSGDSRQQMYLTGDELIPLKGIDKAYKYHTKKVLEKLASVLEQQNDVNAISIKITQDDCAKFYQNEVSWIENIVQRHQLHNTLTKIKRNELVDSKKIDDYKKSLAIEADYQWLKSRITFAHVERLSDLLHDIFATLIQYTSTWERDLYYITLKLLKDANLLSKDKIVQALDKDQSKVDFVCEILCIGTKECADEGIISIKHSLFGLMNIKDDTDFNQKKGIRNNLAHYHYFRGDKEESYSILDYLSQVRYLMGYDRKRKNEVTKAVIDLIKKKGISIKLEISHESLGEKIVLVEHPINCKDVHPDYHHTQKVLPLIVYHFQKQKLNGQKVFSSIVHPDYCKMVQALLELKM